MFMDVFSCAAAHEQIVSGSCAREVGRRQDWRATSEFFAVPSSAGSDWRAALAKPFRALQSPHPVHILLIEDDTEAARFLVE
ncbi:MAG TPA: hypothetical protein VGC34_11075, partial [Steroidobacteraceae bacterium]